MGMRHLVVLVNKMDEVGWSRDRYMAIIEQLKPFLANAGFDVEKQIHWVPIAGLHGDNMAAPSKNKLAEWYRGDTFFGVLDELSLPNRDGDAPLRIPVLDKIRDQGLFITGKIEQGCIKVDHHVQLLPQKKIFQIAQILNSRDQSVYYAKPGENVKIKVRGLEDEDIKKG